MNSKYKIMIVNLLIAVAISMVVNFSYILSMLMQESRDRDSHRIASDEQLPTREGVLVIAPDGYGYIVSADTSAVATDSIYAPSSRIWRYRLKSGQRISATVAPPTREGAHPVMMMVKTVDGQEFDYGELFNRPSDTVIFIFQFCFYIVLAFLLLSIITARNSKSASLKSYVVRFLYCSAITLGMYFLTPVVARSGEMMPIFNRAPYLIDPMEILKCSFTLVVAMLYGRTFQLIMLRQEIALENEHLKNENLMARYTMLVNQINPHFLFNSLNSLSMLVREDKKESALTYIERLSYTFRYIIRNEQHKLLPLSSEMEFLDAYKYLLEIRYADKLFFDIDIKENKLGMCLPALSVQPLIENAVKHNSITRGNPFRISIATEGDYLVISNPIRPKMEPENSTGIGLKNLSSRYKLLTDKNIEIIDDGQRYTVRLPLSQAACNRP